jgi:hypothetical protein
MWPLGRPRAPGGRTERLEAECDLASSLPIDDLLWRVRAALLPASREKVVEKLRQVLAGVVDSDRRDGA